MSHLLMFRFSTGNRLVHNNLMDDFFWDNWCFEIYKARHKLREITGWNMNNNSYNKKDIVGNIIKFYDDIYRDAVKYYLVEADTYPDLKYGTSYFPKECPWSLQDLIRAPYRNLLKMIHDPKDDEDSARLLSRCKYIDEFARERREEEG